MGASTGDIGKDGYDGLVQSGFRAPGSMSEGSTLVRTALVLLGVCTARLVGS